MVLSFSVEIVNDCSAPIFETVYVNFIRIDEFSGVSNSVTILLIVTYGNHLLTADLTSSSIAIFNSSVCCSNKRNFNDVPNRCNK